jgi:hypothetical protein
MYHIPLIYIIDEGGYYIGSYYDKFFQITGCFQAKTHEEMYNQCYESLRMCMEDENKVPFNVDDMKNSVVFDEIKCETDEETDIAHDMQDAGQGFAEIFEAINK